SSGGYRRITFSRNLPENWETSSFRSFSHFQDSSMRGQRRGSRGRTMAMNGFPRTLLPFSITAEQLSMMSLCSLSSLQSPTSSMESEVVELRDSVLDGVFFSLLSLLNSSLITSAISFISDDVTSFEYMYIRQLATEEMRAGMSSFSFSLLASLISSLIDFQYWRHSETWPEP
ncbi:hypothetical protein PMAYCL1PPCAC_07612, partial [Pristionchus mayeri]